MPRNTSPEQLAREWRTVCERYTPEVRERVRSTVAAQREALATAFYDQMLLDQAASFFLSDQLVKSRLHTAMQAWLVEVFEAGVNGDFEHIVARQRMVGEVHARIGIPAYLVMRGIRQLDHEIYDLLNGDAHAVQMAAATYVAETTGLAIEIMCHSYSVSHERNARAEESYRMFAMAQDIGAEKERQRAALLDWENQLMFELSTQISAAVNPPEGDGGVQRASPSGGYWPDLPMIAKSEFGLWFLHKAAHAFEGAADIKTIGKQLEEIDELLRPPGPLDASAAKTSLSGLMVAVRGRAKTIGFLLEQLFQQASHMESGRDALTRLLNRKYLQVIMTREIDFARKNDSPLSLLALDIDHFKRINDSYGHDAGDVVLQQVAQNLTHIVRSGDYIFRLGGEEFLVVLVDVDSHRCRTIAESIRQRIAAERLQLPNGRAIDITLSIGIATHDGHPDYLRLLKTADDALYDAKNGGRNRVSGGTHGLAV